MIGFLETEFHGNSDLYTRSELEPCSSPTFYYPWRIQLCLNLLLLLLLLAP